MSDEPRRWTDDPEAPEGVSEALRSAREELPTDAQLAAVAAGLGPLLGGGGGGGGAGGPGSGGGGSAAAAGATGMASGTKVVIFLVVGTLTVASLGTWAVIEDRKARPVQWPVDAGEIVGDGGATPAAEDGVDGSTGVDSAASSLPPSPPLVPDPSPAPSPSRSPSSPPPSPTDPAPPTELTLLRDAQDALTASPTRALALTVEHARAYPAGALEQEREVIAIDALLRLGRRGEAEARAGRFQQAHPSSSQNRRLDQLLARE